MIAAAFSLASSIGASRATSWQGYLVARFFLGIGIGAKASIVVCIHTSRSRAYIFAYEVLSTVAHLGIGGFASCEARTSSCFLAGLHGRYPGACSENGNVLIILLNIGGRDFRWQRCNIHLPRQLAKSGSQRGSARAHPIHSHVSLLRKSSLAYYPGKVCQSFRDARAASKRTSTCSRGVLLHILPDTE